MPAVTERDFIASESDFADLSEADGDQARDQAHNIGAEKGVGAKADPAKTETIALVEETAFVEIMREDRGGTRVRIVTDEDQVSLPVALTDQTVEITRHPVNVEIDAVPSVREEGDVTIIPVVEERAVIVKRLFLTEEIHIQRNRQHRDETVQVTLRRQRAEFQPLTANASPDDCPDKPATDRPHSA